MTEQDWWDLVVLISLIIFACLVIITLFDNLLELICRHNKKNKYIRHLRDTDRLN